MNLETAINSYEWGWNLTRAYLLNYTTFTKRDIFDNLHVYYDYSPRRNIAAERLHQKYAEALAKPKPDKPNYYRGAIDLIREWDTMGQVPDELEVISFADDEEVEDE